ncbi:hypothetical protein ABZ746_25970 [Streptomyces sp. NPDC020096]
MTTIARTISRTGKRYTLPELEEVEPPAVSRVSLTATAAELLNQQGQQALSVDRLLRDPASGTRLAQRVLIPLSVAADVPGVADTPDAPLPELYAHFHAAGHELTWDEEVSAATPLPDERTTLGLTGPEPILITYRITRDQATDRPLMVEELRVSAEKARLAYPITPATAAPTKRPRRGQAE